MPPRVRLAEPDDLPVLADLHRSAFDPRQAWSEDAIRDQLRVDGTIGLVHATDGMALVRFVVEEAEILTLAVRPTARRRGIGRALLSAAMQRARQMNIGTVYLEVSERNEPAQALYQTLGFNRIGVRRRYYEDGTNALVMTAKLD